MFLTFCDSSLEFSNPKNFAQFFCLGGVKSNYCQNIVFINQFFVVFEFKTQCLVFRH